MWPEGEEKVFIPWHEASVFVPPNRWFHQHFNVSDHDDRYLAFHAPRGAPPSLRPAADQIEYYQEDPLIRQSSRSGSRRSGSNRSCQSRCYKNPSFEWDYGDGADD